MTEAEWLASDDPTRMLGHLHNDGTGLYHPLPECTLRKLRLLIVACCRGRAWGNGHSPGLNQEEQRAAAALEKHADVGVPHTTGLAFEKAWRNRRTRFPAPSIALDTVAGTRMLAQHMVEPPRPPGYQEFASSMLREVFGNPFRQVVWTAHAEGPPSVREINNGDLRELLVLRKHWLTWREGIVPRLAQEIYDGRHFDRLPILADALEEAGCTARGCIHCGYGDYINLNPPCGCATSDLLLHLRHSGPHVRGCWALDLLLGKE